ncbi:MAG: ribosome biogenesis GTPase Der [Mycoplasmataceae bacterium]|nr:ribosome biogenesis GTPase Der [Mycoplasmataceae bacterium]
MYKIALVGKPNVGKSTLFNRLTNSKKAISLDIPGTTRDRINGKVEWLNKIFFITDTGGITNQNLKFQKEISQQVNYAIEESNLILFIVSAKDGIDNDDKYIAKILKKSKLKNIILVINKAEKQDINLNQFQNLGFKDIFLISAEHGIGVGDLLDKISTYTSGVELEEKTHTSFCIIGKTNVGKSTLMNTILHEERVLVSPIEHTTRDAIDQDFFYNKELFTLIDTAGIRRKGHISDPAEKFSVMRTEKAIERSDIILFVIDGSIPFTEQDEVIGGLAFKANIPTIIVVNKWDDVKKDTSTMNKMTKTIRQKFVYLSWAPLVFISAKNNSRIETIFTTLNEIRRQLEIKVSTGLLNDLINKAQINNPAPFFKGGRIRISYATQTQSQIPTFVLFCNDPSWLHFTYARYIENQIRESFGIKYVPITVYYKDKNARIRTDNK